LVRAPPIGIVRALLPELIQFFEGLRGVRVGRSIRVTSWWRSSVDNRRVGGHPDSQHRLGLALDLIGEEEELLELLLDVRQVGMVAVLEPTHLHIQLLPAGVARLSGLFDRSTALA